MGAPPETSKVVCTDMDLPHPETLSDLIVDGIIEQKAIDRALAPVTDVECDDLDPNDETPDATCRIRLHPGPRDQNATRVARVEQGVWRWLTSRTVGFDVAALHNDQPATDDLVHAVRTLFGNAPALLIPQSDATVSVVVLHGAPATLPVPDALAVGLPAVPAGRTVRALKLFAATRGLNVRESSGRVELSDGTAVVIDSGEGIDVSAPGVALLADVRADAVLLSAEHQLLFDGRFPDAQITFNAAASRAQVTSQGRTLTADAHLLGLIRGDTWVWGWSDPRLNTTRAAHLVRGVYRFGVDHKIPALTRPVSVFRDWLITACKPILGRWVHGFVHLGDAVAVVALEHPELTLPAPTEAAVLATLQFPVGPGVDIYRAVGAYANSRGLAINGESLLVPDTHRALDLSVRGQGVNAVPRGIPQPGAGR